VSAKQVGLVVVFARRLHGSDGDQVNLPGAVLTKNSGTWIFAAGLCLGALACATSMRHFTIILPRFVEICPTASTVSV
jgi:hypothetical protein